MQITVNGHTKNVSDPRLTYGQIVGLAFQHPDAHLSYCVKYQLFDRWGKALPGGLLVSGQSIAVQEGASFVVTP